jgi:hypothetical protein
MRRHFKALLTNTVALRDCSHFRKTLAEEEGFELPTCIVSDTEFISLFC